MQLLPALLYRCDMEVIFLMEALPLRSYIIRIHFTVQLQVNYWRSAST